LNQSTSHTNKPVCFQCGSHLVQISKVTSHPENSLFPQTTSIFRCSNEVCQAEKDKEEEKRLKQQSEKNEAALKRADERQKAHEDKVMAAIAKTEGA